VNDVNKETADNQKSMFMWLKMTHWLSQGYWPNDEGEKYLKNRDREYSANGGGQMVGIRMGRSRNRVNIAQAIVESHDLIGPASRTCSFVSDVVATARTVLQSPNNCRANNFGEKLQRQGETFHTLLRDNEMS
jgi:hypothetical protein